MDSWLTDFMGGMEKRAEKIRVEEQVKERLKNNAEYQDKTRTIDIRIGLLDEKKKELIEEKAKLKLDYMNKELENMGSTYRFKMADKNDPLGLFK